MKWKELKKKWNAKKQALKKSKSNLEKKLEAWLISKGHKRRHCWPTMDARRIEFILYKKAVEDAKFCYWAPYGWLPWSGNVIARKYRKLSGERDVLKRVVPMKGEALHARPER